MVYQSIRCRHTQLTVTYHEYSNYKIAKKAYQRFEEVKLGGACVQQRMKCSVFAELAAYQINDMTL